MRVAEKGRHEPAEKSYAPMKMCEKKEKKGKKKNQGKRKVVSTSKGKATSSKRRIGESILSKDTSTDHQQQATGEKDKEIRYAPPLPIYRKSLYHPDKIGSIRFISW